MAFSGMISVASAILLLAGPPAEPKTYTLEDALQICARVQNPADRLACFEGLAKSTAPEAKKGSTDTEKKASETPTVAPPPQDLNGETQA